MFQTREAFLLPLTRLALAIDLVRAGITGGKQLEGANPLGRMRLPIGQVRGPGRLHRPDPKTLPSMRVDLTHELDHLEHGEQAKLLQLLEPRQKLVIGGHRGTVRAQSSDGIGGGTDIADRTCPRTEELIDRDHRASGSRHHDVGFVKG